MAKINLPTHVARGLFFALCHVGGVRRGPIHYHNLHGQCRSVFERLGPHARCNAGNGGHGPFGRLFDSIVRGLRADAVPRHRWSLVPYGRHASPRNLRLQSQPPSPCLGMNGAGPSNAAPRDVEALAPPTVEALMPPVDEVVVEPVVVPAYIPMEPMSPAPAPNSHWCDFCKEYMSIPHMLEYAYSMPMPTPASPTPVEKGNCIPPLGPWFLNTQAAPTLDVVKVEDEVDMVAAPGVGNLFNLHDIFNTAARTSPLAPPPPATRAEAAARKKAQALPGPPLAETLPTLTLWRFLGHKTRWKWTGTLASVAPVPGTRQILVSEHGGAQHGDLRQRLLLPDEGESSSAN